MKYVLNALFVGFVVAFSGSWGLADPGEKGNEPSPAVIRSGDRLTLHTDGMSLRAFLKKIEASGIQVVVDPGALNRTISGRFSEKPLSDALEQVLGNLSFVVRWQVVPGPAGDIAQPAKLVVYRKGQRARSQPLNATATNASTPSFRVDHLPDGTPIVPKEVLVGFNRRVSPQRLQELLNRMDASIVDSLPDLGIYRLRLAGSTSVTEALKILRNTPEVARTEPNYIINLMPNRPHKASTAGDLLTPKQLASPKDVLQPNGGASNAVAVFDSGLKALATLSNQVVASYNAVKNRREVKDPTGHGTQMALLASGNVAPLTRTPSLASATDAEVPIVAVRAFDDQGRSSNFTMLRGLRFARKSGARVINMSFGTDVESDFMRRGVAMASQEGMVPVAAAGNTPSGEKTFPAAFPETVAVSALNPNGEPWPQSNFGDFVDLSAPGAAEMPVGHEGPPGTYAGTSIASALVSRELARILQDQPSANRQQALQQLNQELQPWQNPERRERFGAGRLQPIQDP